MKMFQKLEIHTFRLGLFGCQWLRLLALETRICFPDPHWTGNDLLSQAEVGLIKHVYSQLHRLGAKVH